MAQGMEFRWVGYPNEDELRQEAAAFNAYQKERARRTGGPLLEDVARAYELAREAALDVLKGRGRDEAMRGMSREIGRNSNSGNTLEDASKAFGLAQTLASDAYWKERDREDAMQEAVEAQKAAVGARHPGLMMPTGTPSGVPSEAYQQAKAQQDAMIAQKVARLKELEMARAEKMQKFRDDPKFRMAAMLAMAGQPGALQALIAEGSKSGNTAQSDMDALEKSMTNDIFALASADEDQSAKIMEALIPLYKSKFDEIQGKGGMSRLGGWDAWEEAIRSAKGRRAKKKAKKDELDAALDKSIQNKRGNK